MKKLPNFLTPEDEVRLSILNEKLKKMENNHPKTYDDDWVYRREPISDGQYLKRIRLLISGVVNAWFDARLDYEINGSCSNELIEKLNDEKDKLVFMDVILRRGNRLKCIRWIVLDVLNFKNPSNVYEMLYSDNKGNEKSYEICTLFSEEIDYFVYALSFREFLYDNTFLKNADNGFEDVILYKAERLRAYNDLDYVTFNTWRSFSPMLLEQYKYIVAEWCYLFMSYKIGLELVILDFWLERFIKHVLLFQSAIINPKKHKRHEYTCFLKGELKIQRPECVYDFARCVLKDAKAGNDYYIAQCVEAFSNDWQNVIDLLVGTKMDVIPYIQNTFGCFDVTEERMENIIVYLNKVNEKYERSIR